MHNNVQYMARIALSLLLPLVMLAATGCSDDDIDGGLAPEAEAGYISINLNASKSSRAADDTRNEDLIKSVVICLYPNGGTTAPSTPTHVVSFDNIDKNQTHSVKIKLNKSLATGLFGNGNGSCTAYVIANLPDADAAGITTETPLEDIKKIAVNPDFASMLEQPSFVMDGSATVTRSGAGTANDMAAGTIQLVRSASKISLAVRVTSQYVAPDGAIWTPNTDGMSVLITNGVTRSQVESSTYTPQTSDYYRTTTGDEHADHRNRTFTKDASADPATGYPYQLTCPFYTFPNSWNPDDVESPMTYMTLIVPWKKGDEDRYRTCYYMVPIIKGFSLNRNIAYSVKLNVNVLGSFTPDIPMELTDMSYYAVEWGDVGMDVDITGSRYLVVDSHNYIMNNDTHISIPVYTSHKTTIRDITMTYYRYHTSENGDEYAVNISKTVIDNTTNDETNKTNGAVFCTYDFKNTGDGVNMASVEFSHDLSLWVPYRKNNYNRLVSVAQDQLPTYAEKGPDDEGIYLYRPDASGDGAYSRYEIAITFQHEDMSGNSFKETVNIVQYPAMYILTDPNTRATTNGINTNAYKYGNVYINNNNNTNDDWGKPLPLQGDNNANPNMYLINTTQLSENTRYIIGDPRTDNVNNPNYTFVSAKNMSGTTQQSLKNYYPTDENKDKYIAPVFRVASSRGKSYTISKNEAIRRCASFQEKNCPAGRWRLPTRSELEYIATLSSKGYIPELLTLGYNSSGYWTAQGRVSQKPTSNGILNITSGNSAWVRCVYDEWYWKDKVQQDGTIWTDGKNSKDTGIPYYPFTWGDEAMKMNSL